MSARNLGRQGAVLVTVALVAVVAGAVLLVIALRAQTSAATPHDAGSINPPPTVAPSTPAAGGSAAAGPAPLTASAPVSISIPAIKIRTAVNPIGLAKDGTIEVPQPGPRLNQAAWFKNSPTPGQPGPSIIEGHVDSVSGPSVFYDLGNIRPGERILVTRADGTRLTFTVDAIRNYLKANFPTNVVYGAKDLSVPALRLITCSQFDQATHHHIGNAVVFAHLTHVSGRSGTS